MEKKGLKSMKQFVLENFGGGGIFKLPSLKSCSIYKKYYNSDIKHHYCKRFAFTLAEVLITLGIIGVVAALTMPTLITKYQKKATAAKLKNAYSTLQNAVLMSSREHAI